MSIAWTGLKLMPLNISYQPQFNVFYIDMQDPTRDASDILAETHEKGEKPGKPLGTQCGGTG